MSPKLPLKGLWHVSDRQGAAEMPFDAIKLDLRDRGTGTASGIVRARNLETRLGRVHVTGPDRFTAVYDIRGNRGRIEGTIRTDGSLRLSVSGTVSATLVACEARPAMAEAASTARALAWAFDDLCRSAGIGQGAAA